MKKIFAILLSLALVVSLGVMTVAPVGAVTQPSISPTSALYDLDAPAQVTTTITWGGAVSLDDIILVGGDSIGNANWDRYDDLLVIDEDYLDDVLTYIGDSITLVLVFDVGVATLTITATGTSPACSPSSATWVVGSDTGVSTTILWGPYEGLDVSLSGACAGDFDVLGDLLVIDAVCLDSYIEGVGDYKTFTVLFSDGGTPKGAAVFTVVGVGDNPTISPASTTWQIGSGSVVTTMITFNSATALTDVTESGGGIAHTLYDTLVVIPASYLETELLEEGDTIALVLEFDSGLYNCILTITAVGEDVPTISPASATYCVGSGDNVTTTVTSWGNATGIASIVDVTGLAVAETLKLGTDYWVDGNTLIIAGDTGFTDDIACAVKGEWGGLEVNLDCNLRGARLLKVTFNDNADTEVIFTVARDSSCCALPALSSTTLTWDLDKATSTSYLYDSAYVYAAGLVTWGNAEDIASITDDTGCTNSTLKAGMVYAGNDYYCAYYAPYATYVLFIYGPTYLQMPCLPGTTFAQLAALLLSQGKISAEGAAALGAIGGEVGAGADLTEIGDDVVLTIDWAPKNGLCAYAKSLSAYEDKFPPTKLTITAIGTSASISPSSGEFDIDDPGNVTAEIEWGPHAADIDKITCGLETLESTDYTFESTTTPDGVERDNSKLTIMSTWLAEKLEDVGDTIVLDVDFDTGEDGKLTITAVGTPLCFIATAAGADAPQLDILREFRDEVLRPNAPWLVSLYYEVSPPIANVIAGNEALKKLVMDLVVEPAVFIAGKVMD